MAKRQERSAAVLGQGESCKIAAFKTDTQRARERLAITAEQMEGVPRIAPMLECCEGGIERIIEALRWSPDTAARTFLKKYDSVPRPDLKHF